MNLQLTYISNNMKLRFFQVAMFLGLLLCTSFLLAQSSDEKLAIQYANTGECEKASILFEGVIKSNTATTAIYYPYLSCLEQSKDYKSAIRLAKHFARSSQRVFYDVDEAYFYAMLGEKKKASKLYSKLVSTSYQSRYSAIALSSALRNRSEFDLAKEVLKKNQDHELSPYLHVITISQINYLQGNKQQSLEGLLAFAVTGASPYRQVVANLPVYLNSSEDYALLRTLLIKKIRTEKFPILYEEMLSWAFVQQKDWSNAFVHYKSISKKKNDQGRALINLADLCTNNKEYTVASKCYAYVLELGNNQRYYHQAQAGWLSSRYNEVISVPYPDSASLALLEKDFLAYIESNNRNPYAAKAMWQLSEIYIKQLQKPKKAIDLLEKGIKLPAISDKFKAECKLDLGDAYLFTGDVWESELLYAQVEKSFKEEPLGQEAKFRKARLAYFRSEFTWAEKQLEVLKGATSQLISNNAIELALHIQDNLGLDSNYVAMEAYANAELFLFQNKTTEAMKEADKIALLFPGHSLEDEVHYLKARVYGQLKNWDQSIASYKIIIKQHKADILYDNALFELASIYENQLKDTANAMKYYEKLILEEKGSLFVVESSKRYRALRGDVIKEQDNYYFKP